MPLQTTLSLTPAHLTAAAGLGVAGNFAGHLEQAGEANDFKHVVAPVGKPKGIFPFWLPADDGTPTIPPRLRVHPTNAETLTPPPEHPAANLQIEPELGLWCELTYNDAGQVTAVRPRAAGAFNDCSWRRPSATKISQKKNWGPHSQGFAHDQLFALTNFTKTGELQSLRLASFLRRDQKLHPYGEDAPVAGYGCLHQDLLDWLVDRCQNQHDHGPLENVGAMLRAAGRPTHALIAIGATRYLPFGETNYLQPQDEAIVSVYDPNACSPEQLIAHLQDPAWPGAPWVSLLRQHVAAGGPARPASPPE